MIEGWHTKRLDEICSIARGGSPRPIKSYLTTDPKGINWIKISDATASGKYIYSTVEKIRPEGVSKSRLVKPGDFLLSNSMSFGRPYIMKTTGCIHDGWLVLSDRSGAFDPDYLYYFLGSDAAYKQFDQLAAGSTVRNLNIELASRVNVLLPPLDEQKRIVAFLDEAFEGIDKAIANTEKNLANARELFDSYLRSIFDHSRATLPNSAVVQMSTSERKATKTSEHDSASSTKTGGRAATERHIPGPYSLSVGKPKGDLRAGWQWSPLSDLGQMESGHTPSRRHPEYWGGEIPWIGIKDAKAAHAGVIQDTTTHTNDLGIANSSARVLPTGTVCLSRTASVGYVTVLGRPMATSQDFVSWICSDALVPHYLKYLLVAQGTEIFRFSSGSVHQTIYFPEAKAFWICHPSICAQNAIVAAIDDVRGRSEALENANAQKLTSLRELKQSLLAKAFSGQLTVASGVGAREAAE